jgi:chromosome segregation ATPase
MSNPGGRKSLSASERKLVRLEDRARRAESRLLRAERRETVMAERLGNLASENQRLRQELHDAEEEGEEVKGRLKMMEKEMEQYYAWWIKEVQLSRMLLQQCGQDTAPPQVPIARIQRSADMNNSA